MASIIESRYSGYLRIGIIRHCEKKFSYGIIQSWDTKSVYKLFPFSKSEDFCLDDLTLVLFCNKDNDVTHVISLDNLEIIPDEYPTRQRDNGLYYGDKCWNLLISKIPFIRYQKNRLSVIYIPENYTDTPIPVIENIVSGFDECILDAYIQMKSLKIDSSNYKELSAFIIEKKEYIELLDISEIISEFSVMRVEKLQRRPGRDDHYYIDIYQTLPFDDPYLQYLLPTKTENIFYDNNWSSASDEDNTGSYLLESETQILKDKALKEYSKEGHIAFLIHHHLNKIFEDKIMVEKLRASIYGILGVFTDKTDFHCAFNDQQLLKKLKESRFC